MASANPAEVLFTLTHRQILALLFLHPEASFHVRQIARLTGLAAGSIHRELRRLFDSGLILRESVGNQVHYRANRDCPIFVELAGVFRKTVGLADVIREALSPLQDEIDLVFIFGSVAQGKERAESDVDVMVVGTSSFARIVKVLSQTHERLGREINPVVMPEAMFRKKAKKGDRFVKRIIAEPKIFVVGTESDLGELVKDRAIKKPRS
jgi:predicted nucleotidyltransferase